MVWLHRFRKMGQKRAWPDKMQHGQTATDIASPNLIQILTVLTSRAGHISRFLRYLLFRNGGSLLAVHSSTEGTVYS